MQKKKVTKLIVCGPMLNTYLKELGAMFLSKLLHDKVTGIEQSSKLLIPWQIMVNLILLAKNYGAVVVGEPKKNSKEQKISITVSTDSCISKIWHAVRLYVKEEIWEISRKTQRSIFIIVVAKW